MRITSVAARQVGALRNVELGPLNPALNIIYGPNEAGKTTLKQSLRIGLYPITSGTDSHTYGEGSANREVELTFRDDVREYSVVRRSKSVKTSAPLEGSEDSIAALDMLTSGISLDDYRRCFHVGCNDIAEITAKNISPLMAAQWPGMGNPATLAADYGVKASLYSGTIVATRPFGMKGLLSSIKKQETVIDRLASDMNSLYVLEGKIDEVTEQCNSLRSDAEAWSGDADQFENAVSDLSEIDSNLDHLMADKQGAEIRRASAVRRLEAVDTTLRDEVLEIAPVVVDLDKEHVGYVARQTELESRQTDLQEREIDEAYADVDGSPVQQPARSTRPLVIGGICALVTGVAAGIAAGVLVGLIVALAIFAGTLLFEYFDQRSTPKFVVDTEHVNERSESIAVEKMRAKIGSLLQQQLNYRANLVATAARMGKVYPDEMSCRGILDELSNIIEQQRLIFEQCEKLRGEINEESKYTLSIETEIEDKRRERIDVLELLPSQYHENLLIIPDKVTSLRVQAIDNREKIEARNREIGQLSKEISDLKSRNSVEQEQATLVQLRQKLAHALRQRILNVTASTILTETQIALAGNDKTLVDEASEIFADMTGGRYQGIDCNESEISAINARGDRVHLSKLSEGTFEQLFLALRLGVICAMPNFGGSLPLVLDDVFSHTDQHRLESVFATLARLSLQKQILYFTCHVSVADLFVEVAGRVLPADNVKRFDLEPLPI